MAMCDRPSRLEALKKSQVPTTFIIGDEDKLVSPERSAMEFKDWAKVNVRTLPGVGHMGMYEAREEVAGVILRLRRSCQSCGDGDGIDI